MCPACFQALALLLVGIGSSGGVAAVLASRGRDEGKEDVKDLSQSCNQEETSCYQKSA